jgi:hypothetical protein
VIHYFVGTIFGVVVVVWHVRSVRELVNWRSAAFIATSTLIYVVVRILPDHALDELTSISEIMAQFWSFILEGFKLVGGVAFHSAVLPIAHALLLGASLKRVLVAIPVTLGVWFKASLLWLAIILVLPYPMPQPVLYLINYTSIWQMSYLLTMFAFRKPGVEQAPNGSSLGDLEYGKRRMEVHWVIWNMSVAECHWKKSRALLRLDERLRVEGHSHSQTDTAAQPRAGDGIDIFVIPDETFKTTTGIQENCYAGRGIYLEPEEAVVGESQIIADEVAGAVHHIVIRSEGVAQ